MYAHHYSELFTQPNEVLVDILKIARTQSNWFVLIQLIAQVKKGTISTEKDFIKLATYISFFPQITSGPIVKAHDFLPQLDRLHRIKKSNVYEGIQLFVLGLTKKVVFADRIGVAVNAVYSAPLAYNNISIFWVIVGYSLQIYCDFSWIFRHGNRHC